MSVRLREYQEKEAEYLREARHGRVSRYRLDRDWLAPLAFNYIADFMDKGQQPKILEIGCGIGQSIFAILDDHPNLKASQIIGTSLSELPEHAALKARGVGIGTGIMAEDLPRTWEEQFDIVMACAVMQHTELFEAIPKIMRVIKDGGYLLGYDPSLVASGVESLARQCSNVTILTGEPLFVESYRAFAVQKQS